MRVKKKPGFRTILVILFTVVSIIPILIIGCSYYVHQSGAFKKSAGQELLLLARGLGCQIELYLSAHAGALETLCGEIAPLSVNDGKALNQKLVTMRKGFPGFRHLYVLSPDGTIVATDPLLRIDGISFLGLSYRDREYYKEVLATGRPVYSETFTGKLSRRPTLVIALPVKDEKGQTKAILVGSLDVQRIMELTESVKVAGGIYAVLVDTHGVIISHPVKALRDAMVNLSSEEIAQKALARETGILSYVSATGEKRLGGYTFIEPVGWGVWVSRSFLEQEKVLRDIAVVSVLLVCLSLLVDVLLALFLSRRLAEPLQQLVFSAKKIGEGFFTQSFEWKRGVLYGEVKTLADNVEQMALMLQSRDEQILAHSAELESKVAERTSELSRAHEELLAIQTQLIKSEKLSAVGQLAAGIAHELNNPLAAILTNIQSFPEPSQEEKVKKRLDMLERAVLRCRAIIEKLLNFSRYGKDDTLRDMDLNQVTGETVEFLRAGIGKDEVLLEWTPGDVLPVKGVYGDISQVVTNLVFNARDAVKDLQDGERRKVMLKTFQARGPDERSWSVLEVSDRGSGIPPEVLGKIWDPFYTTKDVGKGTGLGLWMCYEIVKKHGGEIEVDSEEGKGSSFRIKFQAGESASAAPEPQN